MKEIIQKAIEPKIYAYTTPQYKNLLWQGKKEGKGLLKVGYTEKDVEQRVKEQFSTKRPESSPFEILLNESAVDDGGKFFTDHIVHKKLEEKGFKRVAGEWFECSVDDLKSVILEIKMGVVISDNRCQNFNLRPEQQEAVNITAKYFKKYSKEKEGVPPHFL